MFITRFYRDSIYFLTLLIALTWHAHAQQVPSSVLPRGFLERTIAPPPSVNPVDENTANALQDTMLYGTLANIQKPLAPFSYGENTVFVHYDTFQNARVSIAFAHENYSITHALVRLQSNTKVMVYVMPKNTRITTLHYRLIINGVWTHDEQNPNSVVDGSGIRVSSTTMNPLPQEFFPSITYNSETQQARFFLYLNTESSSLIQDTTLATIDTATIKHRAVYLVGDFTGWDPFLFQMKKLDSISNIYYIDVPLTKGTYYYYFQVGNYNILDPKNRSIVPRRTHNLYVNALFIQHKIDKYTGSAYLVAKTSQ